MDAILPWALLLKPIKQGYPSGARGRPPVPVETLLRIYFLQQWYGLSDPGAEDELCDSEAMRRFVGVGVDLEHIPDESTLCKFHHYLERKQLTKTLFELTDSHLSDKGLIMNEGTIVDASIISAPSSTKNKDKARDPDMKQTRKGNQWYFGMKTHIGADTQGRIRSVAVTDASVHGSVIMDDLIHAEEDVLYGDKAYASKEQQENAEDNGVPWRVNRKAKRGKKLNCADKAFNKKSNKTRARVEHAFGIVKHLWGYKKVRYKGLTKNAYQTFTLFMLANFYMCRRELAA